MNYKRLDIIIIITILAALAVTGYLGTRKTRYVIEQRNKTIDSLNFAYDNLKVNYNILKLKFDSLESQKAKVRIIYKNKYEAIQNYNADSLFNEFKRIISNANSNK